MRLRVVTTNLSHLLLHPLASPRLVTHDNSTAKLKPTYVVGIIAYCRAHSQREEAAHYTTSLGGGSSLPCLAPVYCTTRGRA